MTPATILSVLSSASSTSASFLIDRDRGLGRSVGGHLTVGSPTEKDLRDLMTTVARDAVEDVDVRLFDLRRARFTQGDGYRVVREIHDLYQASGRRWAILAWEGAIAALAADAREEIPDALREALFEDEALAFSRLEVDRVATGTELEAIRISLESAPPVLRSLRVLLDEQPGRLSLGQVAKGLGVSDRTLQRRLCEVGTRFQAELDASRVRVAERLLATTDANLAHVAREVGCCSSQHFSRLFRRQTGVTPSRWRAVRREASRADA